MGSLLGWQDVKNQSTAVWNQFGESKWIPYSQVNVTLPNRRDPYELQGCGLGRFAVLAAMGASLERHIDALKKYRDRYDLITCDKGFGLLMSHGLKPDFVQLCDCNIQYKWLEPWIEETKDVKLLATTYANIEWTTRWKGPIYLYANKDALHSEAKFTPILGQHDGEKFGFPRDVLKVPSREARVIPAASNVSNAMLVFMLGVDEINKTSFSGYEHFFLTGYDYSWRPQGEEFTCKTGNYYAFSDPRPKRFYMSHRTMLDLNNEPVLTSENLLFSAKWMYSYVTAYGLPVTNCSEQGILDIPRKRPLEECLKSLNSNPVTRMNLARRAEIYRDASRVYRGAENDLLAARRALWQ